MDTFLTFAFWIIQGGMAALGAYVSLRPQPEERHKGLIVSFVVLFCFGGLINIVQTRRAGSEQAALKIELEKIRQNTEHPPSVQVNIPPAVPPQIIFPPSDYHGKHVSAGFMQFARNPEFPPNFQLTAGVSLLVNIYLINKGSEPVDNFYRYYGVSISSVGNDPDASDKRVSSLLRKDALKNYREAAKTSKGVTVYPGVSSWNTLTTPLLTTDIIDGILKGTSRIYIYAWAHWKDERQDFEQCIWLQAPPSSVLERDKLVWHQCAL